MSAPTPDDTSKMRCTETDDSTNQKNAGTDDASKDSTLAAGGKEKGALDTEEDATTGIRGEIVVVNGEKFHKLPLSISTEEQLNNLKNMRMRHDDIIIAAFPKSGIKQSLDSLSQGNRELYTSVRQCTNGTKGQPNMSAPTPDDTSKMRCTETDDSTNQKNAGTDDASKDSTLAAGGKEKGALDTEEDATTGIRGEIVVVNGEKFHKLPLSISTEEHLNNLKNMRMRHDDIIIAAFPKSGTHWLWEVVHMLTSGKVEYESRAKEHLMLEFNEVEHFDVMPSPRIINTHFLLRYLSQEMDSKKARVLHVLRNPKDIAVSFYYHLQRSRGIKSMPFSEFAQQFMQGGSLPGNFLDYFAYLPEMEKWQEEHPDVPFMNIYFEDMKKHPAEEIKRTAKFLGLEPSDSLCADIAEACSFNKLKTADESKHNPVKHLFKDSKPEFYRKGEIGDWKNHFTVALSEHFDAVIADKLKGCVCASKFTYA